MLFCRSFETLWFSISPFVQTFRSDCNESWIYSSTGLMLAKANIKTKQHGATATIWCMPHICCGIFLRFSSANEIILFTTISSILSTSSLSLWPGLPFAIEQYQREYEEREKKSDEWLWWWALFYFYIAYAWVQWILTHHYYASSAPYGHQAPTSNSLPLEMCRWILVTEMSLGEWEKLCVRRTCVCVCNVYGVKQRSFMFLRTVCSR